MFRGLLAVVVLVGMARADEKVQDLIGEANRLFKERKYDDALDRLNAALKIDADSEAAIDLRGSVHYMKGNFKQAVADFDQFLKLRPKDFNGHWRRGIALYYVGRYADGVKQFEGYEKVDTSDVENTFWHWMCKYRADGAEAARKALLKTGKDRRQPMNEVLALIQGKATPKEVLTAAEGVKDEAERKSALFYGHLYLGLYHDVLGEKKKALEHLEQAAGPYKIGHYMGEVARVHRDWLKAKK